MLASEKARSGPSQKLLEFSRKLQEEKQQQTQALILRQFLMSGEADLEVYRLFLNLHIFTSTVHCLFGYRLN